jgi:O-antigen/teichoic acid export membrane protein
MRHDIASAYLASAAKIGSWVIVSAIVFRWYGPLAFALIALARATLSVLNYAMLGLAPAVIHHLGRAGPAAMRVIPLEEAPANSRLLEYAGPRPREREEVEPRHVVFASAIVVTLASGVIAAIVVSGYVAFFEQIHVVPLDALPFAFFGHIKGFVGAMGIGLVARMVSDAAGAVLQIRRRIVLDNLLVTTADVAWVVFALMLTEPNGPWRQLSDVGTAFAVSNLLLLIVRAISAAFIENPPLRAFVHISARSVGLLLSFGALVTLAQLADYLYAPIDFILINRLLSPIDVATYAPAVQIDGALLILVMAVAGVLLPRTAVAHASGHRQLIREYYIRGSLCSGAMLAGTGVLVWLLSPWIFRLWLGNPMASTQAILPLVLIHTIVGGSSAVGRSILLGMGRVKAFTAAAIISGVANVVLSYCFVRFFGWGLYGIVIGTVVVVVARAGVWMPWYVLKSLREADARATPADPMPPPEDPSG